jgi:hypothetical protein
MATHDLPRSARSTIRTHEDLSAFNVVKELIEDFAVAIVEAEVDLL